jgi:hypothetical protein
VPAEHNLAHFKKKISKKGSDVLADGHTDREGGRYEHTFIQESRRLRVLTTSAKQRNSVANKQQPQPTAARLPVSKPKKNYHKTV